MLIDWVSFKSLIDSDQIRFKYLERANEYFVIGGDGAIVFECSLEKGTNSCDEFEADYKAMALLVQPIDSDGSIITRNKTTRAGWHYEPRSLDFITSKLGSLYNRKHNGNLIDDGTDYGDASMKFYDASGSEITSGLQADLDTDCVKTIVDWQPNYEMDIIGATVSMLESPEGSARAYAWIIIAPDLPEAYGGSVPFMSGGWNCRFFAGNTTTFLDGRGVKSVAPDFVYNSNKFRVIIKHEIGAKIECQFVAEHFKA